VTERVRVRLTGTSATMLATLYGRALDAESAAPILGDPLARAIVARIDIDFDRFGLSRDEVVSVAIRGLYLDRATSDLLAGMPDAAVLHLGCGLDTRPWRVDPTARHRWYEVDLPEVVELRRLLLPDRAGVHRIATSVTAPGWLADVPASQPVVVVAEGVVQYLARADLIRLLQGIVVRFPRGGIAFDAWSPLGAWLGRFERTIRVTHARLGGWGVADPGELEVPGLRFVSVLDLLDVPETARLTLPTRVLLSLMRRVASLRRIGMILRYEFRRPSSDDVD
jgi:O-methyltransferase involved in polyketide biosynthesis